MSGLHTIDHIIDLLTCQRIGLVIDYYAQVLHHRCILGAQCILGMCNSGWFKSNLWLIFYKFCRKFWYTFFPFGPKCLDQFGTSTKNFRPNWTGIKFVWWWINIGSEPKWSGVRIGLNQILYRSTCLLRTQNYSVILKWKRIVDCRARLTLGLWRN